MYCKRRSYNVASMSKIEPISTSVNLLRGLEPFTSVGTTRGHVLVSLVDVVVTFWRYSHFFKRFLCLERTYITPGYRHVRYYVLFLIIFNKLIYTSRQRNGADYVLVCTYLVVHLESNQPRIAFFSSPSSSQSRNRQTFRHLPHSRSLFFLAPPQAVHLPQQSSSWPNKLYSPLSPCNVKQILLEYNLSL